MRTRYRIERHAPASEKQTDEIPYGRRVVIALVAIPLLVWGGWLLTVGVLAHQEGTAAESWPMVYGDVTEAWVTEGSVRNGRLWRPEYTPHVSYEYDVDGQRYEGERIRVLPVGYEDRWRAEGIALRYLNVEPAIIYYDPDDPARSMLEPGWSWGDSFVRLFVGAVVLALGGLFFGLTVGVWRDWITNAISRVQSRFAPRPTA